MPLFACVMSVQHGSTVSDVFLSPFIIPVAGCFMLLGIVVAAIWAGVRTREIRSQERLAAIARGLQPESAWDKAGAGSSVRQTATGEGFSRNDGSTARRAGLILAFTGIGLCSFFLALALILQQRAVLCGGATGLIPLAIGVGFLIDGRLRRTEFNRLKAESPHLAPEGIRQL